MFGGSRNHLRYAAQPTHLKSYTVNLALQQLAPQQNKHKIQFDTIVRIGLGCHKRTDVPGNRTVWMVRKKMTESMICVSVSAAATGLVIVIH